MRQVTHALLTRPPLSHKIFISEENQIKCFVRLACVKHAASVHPEPGSNSHVKVCHLSMSCPVFKLAYQFPFACPLIYCFKVVSFKETFVCCYYSTLKFIESFKVISLFNYQSSFLIAFVSLAISLIILTRFKVFVNTFFKLFFKQRRRRDLNPRAAINDLHPFQGCPFGQLGYFSELYSQPVVANLSL